MIAPDEIKANQPPQNLQGVNKDDTNIPGQKNSLKDSFYATGRRKESSAKVWIKKGSGNIVVNNVSAVSYFNRTAYIASLMKPFSVTNTVGHFDVVCKVSGGGSTGQCEAIRLGISKAIDIYNPMLRPLLKKDSLLTRDSRTVERKKYGRHKARKSTQFSKR